MTFGELPRRRRVPATLTALLAATAAWLPCVHLLFRQSPAEFSRATADDLARRHVSTWNAPERRTSEVAALRRTNPEWDFMWRTFTAWSLANMALRDPDAAPRHLAAVDAIIDETLRDERERGHLHFLLSYARDRDWRLKPVRSQFVDGEIALMLALRRLVREHEPYRAALTERLAIMAARMEQSPLLSAESYPDECWTFCNAIAIAAFRVADALDGTDHSSLRRRWIQAARERLIDRDTGLLVSEYSPSGSIMDGPEGSTIWMVAHCLQIVDEEFAREQYALARRHLGRQMLGFGFSREWPVTRRGDMDVDSGAVIPVLDASAGGSGMAVLGAAAFRDDAYLSSLLASLRCGAFPVRRDGELRFAASNAVGDAVLLYAGVQGPAWEEVRRRARR